MPTITYWPLIRYIHLNPVRAGMVQDAEEHLWSSHPSYVGVAPSPPWLTMDWALVQFVVPPPLR